MIHASYEDWVLAVVVPLRAKHSGWRRLDGQSTGGNRESAGRFRHRNRVWNVHADTHFEPVLLAYQARQEGLDPFVEETTASGTCLNLRPELRSRLSNARFKYFYVYSSHG